MANIGLAKHSASEVYIASLSLKKKKKKKTQSKILHSSLRIEGKEFPLFEFELRLEKGRNLSINITDIPIW